MPLILIVTPGNLLSEKLRQGLADIGQRYEIECWSKKGEYCPICGSEVWPAGLFDALAAWCPVCHITLFTRRADNGVHVVSTDDWRKRRWPEK